MKGEFIYEGGVFMDFSYCFSETYFNNLQHILWHCKVCFIHYVRVYKSTVEPIHFLYKKSLITFLNDRHS